MSTLMSTPMSTKTFFIAFALTAKSLVHAAPAPATADLIQWAEETRATLEFAKDCYAQYPSSKQAEYLRGVVQELIRSSGTRQSKLFTRMALLRVDTLANFVDTTALYRDSTFSTELLLVGIKIALRWYESDVSYLRRIAEGKTPAHDYAAFGRSFAKAITELVPLDRLKDREHYRYYKYLVKWLIQDLNRDANRRAPVMATEITFLEKTLETTRASLDGEQAAKNTLALALEPSIKDTAVDDVRCIFSLSHQVGDRVGMRPWEGREVDRLATIIGLSAHCERYNVRYFSVDGLTTYDEDIAPELTAATVQCASGTSFCVGARVRDRYRQMGTIHFITGDRAWVAWDRHTYINDGDLSVKDLFSLTLAN